MIKVAFHIHSCYSSDSNLSLEKIAEICQKKRIDMAILADHNNLAPEKTINQIRIIPGEEINTREGEIIGIFIKEKILPGLTAKETIKKIKEQGGLVIIPHPFDRFRRKVLKTSALLENINQIDIIEIFTARNLLNSDNKKAIDFAEKYNKAKIVGSDAHLASEIGNAYIEMENFKEPLDFLTNLQQAKFYTKKASILVHLLSKIIKILKTIF